MKKLLLSGIAMFSLIAAQAGIDGTYTVNKFTEYDACETMPYTFAAGEVYTEQDEDFEAWDIVIAQKEGEENVYTISNLIGWDEVLEGTYDAETCIITIAAYSVLREGYYISGNFKGIETAEEMMNQADAYGGYVGGQYSTLLDAKIKIEDGTLSLATPVMVFQDSYYAGYYEAYAVFPCIEAQNGESFVTVVAADVNAPAEYYNLQGIRVANPAHGQMLIKRQGNNATKVIIR